jgi:hypothetical protein
VRIITRKLTLGNRVATLSSRLLDGLAPTPPQWQEATAGFAGDMHMPNGMMFTKGTLSMMSASGWFPELTRFTGSTVRLLGAIPMLH